jgi:hypothetical protein
MKKILRDPLIYFLLVGCGLFLLFDVVASDDATYDSRVIDIDRDALLTFVQYRLRAFEPDAAAARLDTMPEDEFDRLIADYVREEALHREAKALGLDQNDYVIKRRMIQSIQFITDGFVTAAVNVSDEDVSAYYEANRDEYFIDPLVTFTHVFFDGEYRNRDETFALAKASLRELNEQQVPFSDAPQHGERFPYLSNYVERDPTFIISHFGVPIAEQIFAMDPADTVWHGPFESEFGTHLVLLTHNTAGRYPELAEIEGVVRQDAERVAIAAQKDKTIQAIVDTYEIRRTYEREVIGQL